jgi:hypothetical protein
MAKVTVLLPEREFARLDSYCNERGFKKSTLIARLVRDHLDNEHFPGQEVLPLEEEVRRRSETRPKSSNY